MRSRSVEHRSILSKDEFQDASVSIVQVLGPTRSCIGGVRTNVSIKDPREPSLFAVVEPEEVHVSNASSSDTPQCLHGGDIMISTMGDRERDNRGKNLHTPPKTVGPIGIAHKSIQHTFQSWQGTGDHLAPQKDF